MFYLNRRFENILNFSPCLLNLSSFMHSISLIFFIAFWKYPHLNLSVFHLSCSCAQSIKIEFLFQKCYTGIPHSSKVCIMPLSFYEISTLVTVFVSWKTSKENFCFCKKRWNVKIGFSISFVVNHYTGSGYPKHLPRKLLSASQCQATITLNCVCDHLCFISVYFVH